MAVFNYMELSTAHISSNSAEFLNDEVMLRKAGMIAYSKGDSEGWFVWIPDDDRFEEYFEVDLIPLSLLECMKYARENDCVYLMFDVNAEVTEDLPEYEW